MRELRELGIPGSNTSGTEIQARSLTIGSDRQGDPSLLLIVYFRGNQDLLTYANQNNYHIGNDSYICENGNDKTISYSFPGIYSHGRRIDRGEKTIVDVSENKYSYYIFIPIIHNPNKSELSSDVVDLRKVPKDMCFYVRSGDELGSGYQSSTMKVTKSAISDVLGLSKAGN